MTEEMIWLAVVLCACVALSALYYNRLGWSLWRLRRAHHRARCAMGDALTPALRRVMDELSELLRRPDV